MHSLVLYLRLRYSHLDSSLKVAEAALASDSCSSTLFADYADLPQSLRNLPVTGRPPLKTLHKLSAACARVEETLQGKGRIVVRYSGTEDRLRLMAEAESQALVESVLDTLQAAAEEEGILGNL